MGSSHSHRYLFLLLLLLQHFLSNFLVCLVTSISTNSEALTIPKAPRNSVTAVLVFGDSTVDPGNNNYAQTTFKGNFPPYGIDFVNKQATGRFTNGRLATDFFASYVGVKEYVPPYLDPTLTIEELMTGVSFASAGTGFDPLTPGISNVIGMPKQLEYFKEYKKRLELVIGKQKTEAHIEKALVILSAATNDFVISYFSLPIRRQTFSIPQYQRFVLQKEKEFIQALFGLGARRILVTGLSPMGCLPLVITLFSNNALADRTCLDYFSSISWEYNRMLQAELSLMQTQLAHQGARIYLSNPYGPLFNMIHGPQSSAFDQVDRGCCGSGFLEVGSQCNSYSNLCPDRSKYVFFDSIHPTEQAYYNLFNAARPLIDFIIRD